jgi:serine/threonine-protein kinase
MNTLKQRHTGRCWHAAAAVWVLGVALFCSADAFAQGDARKASADMLFDEAKRLMNEGKHAEACPKLVASHKLDPALGTLLNLGNCYEKAGKTASAWATFREAVDAASKAGDSRRQQEAGKRAAALRPRLSMVTIAVETGGMVEGLQISTDEVEMDMGALGTPVPLDPGAHTVQARAPGKIAWTGKIQLADGGTLTIKIPRLQDELSLDGPAPVTTAAPVSTAPAPAAPAPERRGSGQRVAGMALTGVGAVAMVTGGILVVTAKSSWDDARSRCPDNRCESQADVDQSADARSRANVAGIVMGAGAACAVGGVVLWLLSPPKSSNRASTVPVFSPVAGPGFAGLGVHGGF